MTLAVTGILRFASACYLLIAFFFYSNLLCKNKEERTPLSVQLKPGGAIPEKGKRITLLVKDVCDLSRDVIKVCFFCSDPFLIYVCSV